MFFLYALASHRPDSVALALWSFTTVRGRWPSWHPVFSTPDPGPTGKSRADDALLFIKQRERKQVPVCWHLLFCRLFYESAYRHLGLQFYNLFVCRNPTSPNVDASHPYKLISGYVVSISHVQTIRKHFFIPECGTIFGGTLHVEEQSIAPLHAASPQKLFRTTDRAIKRRDEIDPVIFLP
jgi:hypothetical protein